MSIQANLLDIYSGFLSAEAFNANNTLIEEALGKALNREGGVDNAMEADFDMGMYNIFNLKSAILNHQAVPLKQVHDILKASSDEMLSQIDMEDRVIASEGQQVIELESIEYIPTTNSLMVFRNGEYQRPSAEYLETGNTSIEFTYPLLAGDEVDIFGARFDAAAYVDLAKAAAAQAESHSNQSLAYSNQSSAYADQSKTYSEESATYAGDSLSHSLDSKFYADNSQSLIQEAQDIKDDVIAASALGYKLGINNQIGLTYTLALEDAGNFIRMDNDLENTVVVPTHTSVPFDIGTVILVRQSDAGETTITPQPTVTVNAPFGNTSTSAKDFGVALVKVANNEWDLIKAFGGLSGDDLTAVVQEFDARLNELMVEILSASPTFVVNFDELRKFVENVVDDVNNRMDSVEVSLASAISTLNDSFELFKTQTNGTIAAFEQDSEQAFSNFKTDIEDSFSDLSSDFSTLSINTSNSVASITNGFSAIEDDFSVIQNSFAGIQSNFSTIQTDFTSIQNAFAGINTAFTTIQNDWADVDQRMDTLQDSIDALNLGQGFDNQKARTGYTYLPNGLIFQWGYDRTGLQITANSAPPIPVSFPVEFPNACLNVTCTPEVNSHYSYKGIYETWVAVRSLTRSSFIPVNMHVGDHGGSGDARALDIYWFAIGY